MLVGGGCADDGTAHFGKVVSKVPVHRLNDVDRAAGEACSDQQHQPDEDLGAFFRRVPPAAATEALKDLALLLPNEITEQDYVDLGETQRVQPRGDGRGVRGVAEGLGLPASGASGLKQRERRGAGFSQPAFVHARRSSGRAVKALAGGRSQFHGAPSLPAGADSAQPRLWRRSVPPAAMTTLGRQSRFRIACQCHFKYHGATWGYRGGTQ